MPLDRLPQRWTAPTVPEPILKRHLERRHGKRSTWLEENREDLRSAHIAEHITGRADHELDDDLT